jgi:hypothetical protein
MGHLKYKEDYDEMIFVADHLGDYNDNGDGDDDDDDDDANGCDDAAADYK